MNIIINATDIHSGGGKVMLNDFLLAATKINKITFYVFTDYRFNKNSYTAQNIYFIDVSIIKRVFVDRMIKKLAESNDLVLFFGNMPPFIKQNCTVIQFFQNRYLIDDFSMDGLPIIVRTRLTVEKWAFKIFLKNADYIIVQTIVMKIQFAC